MSLMDPEERTQTGLQVQADVLAAPAPAPDTLLQAAWRDFVFAEVWSRPGLDRRARFLIAIAGAACEGAAADTLDGYLRGALDGGELTLAELREAALHIAVYAGFGRGEYLDAAITRVAGSLGLAPAAIPPVRAAAWEPQARIEEGQANFTAKMHFPAPPPATPYFEGGIINFVFGEMWCRPRLDERARRWLTLVGVADSASRTPIRTHIYAALVSGNTSLEEMQEFVLQYAIHGGWPKASVVQGAVFDMAKLVAEGKPYAD